MASSQLDLNDLDLAELGIIEAEYKDKKMQEGEATISKQHVEEAVVMTDADLQEGFLSHLIGKKDKGKDRQTDKKEKGDKDKKKDKDHKDKDHKDKDKPKKEKKDKDKHGKDEKKEMDKAAKEKYKLEKKLRKEQEKGHHTTGQTVPVLPHPSGPPTSSYGWINKDDPNPAASIGWVNKN